MNVFIIKKTLQLLLFTSLALVFTSGVNTNAFAQTPPQPTSRSIELGAGLNTIVPYANVRFNQDLDTHWTANAAFQIGPAFTKTSDSLALNPLGTLGLKYYFMRQGLWQPFLGADLGVAWVPDRVTPLSQADLGVFGQLGVGTDLMFSHDWGISVALRSNLNLLNASLMSGTLTIRPEISAVWRF